MCNRVLALLAALLVTACGGGGGGDSGGGVQPAIAPTLTTQPQNVSVVDGQPAQFSVTAGGTAPLTYQWRKSGTDIAGAISASYTTPAVTIADTGATYSVVVRNSAGSVTSSNAALTVTAAQPPTTGVLTGLVREYASNIGDLDPVAEARVEVVSGIAAGRNVTTGLGGEYRLQDLPAGAIQLRITKAGFQDFDITEQASSSTKTLNMLVRRDCSPWPAQLGDMMSKLSLPSGLCLIRQPNGRASNYQTTSRTVYLRSASPVGGELAALSHELVHAHQHRAVLDAGLGEPGFDEDFVPKWVASPEGTRFVQLTGWLHDPTANQHVPPFGWTERCELWSCGYQNPIEDAAEFGSNYYNVNNVYNRSDAALQSAAPNRFQWASEFLPR